MTYGWGSWIQAIEMWYLRAVKGATRRDEIINKEIKEELGVKPILEDIEAQQLK